MHDAHVLVASASAGSGHVRAGEAVRTALNGMGVIAEHFDVLELAPAWVRRAYSGGFELMASRAPRIWKEIYHLTDGPDHDAARWGPLAHRILFREFRKLLAGRKWDAIVATHFLPVQLLRQPPAPVCVVITDWTLHRYWVQRAASSYCVATENLAADLRARTSAPVRVTGIPISDSFEAHSGRAEARSHLNIPETARVALVMGGGFGLGLEKNVEATLRADVADLRVIAVCGRNESAFRSLNELATNTDRLTVVGFTRKIEQYMLASDVLVTKPGGLTTSEAVSLGLPMVLTGALPGHEAANAKVLNDRGAALVAAETADITTQVEYALAGPERLDSLQRSARLLARPRAARDVAAVSLTSASIAAVA